MLECRFKSRLGLESPGFSMWHFLKLVVRGFLQVLQFRFSMGAPVSVFYGYSSFSFLRVVQFQFSTGTPVSVFYGYSSFSFLRVLQFQFSTGAPVSVFYGCSSFLPSFIS